MTTGSRIRGVRRRSDTRCLKRAKPGYADFMGIGTSLFLVATGAILRWAVADAIEGVNLATVGLILLIVGVVGLVLSFVLAQTWNRRDTIVTRDRYVDRTPPTY